MMGATTKILSIEESISASLSMVFVVLSCKHRQCAVTNAITRVNLFHYEISETRQKRLVLVLAFTSEVEAAQQFVHRLIERLLSLFNTYHDADCPQPVTITNSRSD